MNPSFESFFPARHVEKHTHMHFTRFQQKKVTPRFAQKRKLAPRVLTTTFFCVVSSVEWGPVNGQMLTRVCNFADKGPVHGLCRNMFLIFAV
jgi:hypothetical protein